MKTKFYKNTMIKASLSLIAILPLMGGCDNFTETGLTPTQLDTNAVFENSSTATAALTDIYARIREASLLSGKNSGTGYRLGLYADELTWYGSTAIQTAFYNNSVLPSTAGLDVMWNNTYSQIYATNAVIEGVAASQTLQESDKQQLTGEALFIRALEHFYLNQLWGEVPYITTTDYRINRIASRVSQAEFNQKLIDDLEQAAQLLPDAYIDIDRVRPNSFAARAILARVYLYAQRWAEAANEASAVLNQTELYVWDTDLSQVFLKDNATTILQLKPRNEGLNTDEASSFYFNSTPTVVSLRLDLIAAFETGDLRLSNWTRKVTNNNGTWYHAYKYKERTNTGSSVEYSKILRLAEQYLIRAEARARQGELIGALEDLNVIRNTAGLGNCLAVSQEEVIQAILKERRVELFTEYGHRFMDLKRYNQLDAALETVKPGWDTTNRLLPIAESELSLNPNLKPQNPGY